MNLPFSYKEFFKIACAKIKFQIELISKTDKLATFFKAMDVMIDTKSIMENRDFVIDTPDKITIKMPGGEKKEVAFPAGTKILFLRLSAIYTQFARSSYNNEDSTQSTIEQNLRSHPSYIGCVHARRFNWHEVVEVPRGGFENSDVNEGSTVDNTMVRKIEKKFTNSSCIALNYEIFWNYMILICDVPVMNYLLSPLTTTNNLYHFDSMYYLICTPLLTPSVEEYSFIIIRTFLIMINTVIL